MGSKLENIIEEQRQPSGDEPKEEHDEYVDDLSLYEDEDQYDQYRSLSISAVTTLIFGVMSVFAVLLLIGVGVSLVLPAVGSLLGVYAVWVVYSRPEEFTGKRMAVTGLGLSVASLLLGIALTYHLNSIAVPEVYKDRQVYFWELQPKEEIDLGYLLQLRGRDVELPLPEKAKDLDGQKVFITGYVYPGEQRSGLKKFVLVPDKGTCCFGGQPSLTDMIEVTLADPLRADYSWRKRGVAGTLKVHSTLQARDQLTGVVYELDADYLSEGAGRTGFAGG